MGYTEECYQAAIYRYGRKTTKNRHRLLFTHGRKMADSEETWFKQRNKYPYLNLMLIMSAADCTTIKDIHDKLKKAGKWVDVRKFVKEHKHYNPLGLFEVFGEFSDQNENDVRD